MNDEHIQPADEETRPDQDTVEQELVAYLDGELDVQAAQQVEQRLAEDPEYRGRLQELDQAWDLLDQLPHVEAPDDFTQSTVEMVAMTAENDLERLQTGASWRRGLRWIVGGGGVVAAAVIGYFLIAVRVDSPNQQLVRDLPVIENIDLYRHVESVEFLRQLNNEGLFVEEMEENGL